MHVTEPMTMVTDYLLAAGCVFFGLSLLSRSRQAGRGSVGLWVAAFAVTAVAALAGGTAHGFRLYLGEVKGSVVWGITRWSIGAGAVLLFLAGFRSALRPQTDVAEDRKSGVGWLKRGIVVSALGIILMLSKASLHEHFNHNDLYHVAQMVGLYFFYKGAVQLHGLA